MKESGWRGRQAEQKAAQFLKLRGLVVLESNFSCRWGEVGLIVREGETLVFVEVRLRQNDVRGGPAESIDGHKQRCLVAAAHFYLKRFGSTPACRFDAVLIMGEEEGLQWLKNIIML
jgi:putative endonuclease